MTKYEQICEFLELLIAGTQSGVLEWELNEEGKRQLCLKQYCHVFAWENCGKVCLSYGDRSHHNLEAPLEYAVDLTEDKRLLQRLYHFLEGRYGEDYLTAQYIRLVRSKLEANAKGEKSNHGM